MAHIAAIITCKQTIQASVITLHVGGNILPPRSNPIIMADFLFQYVISMTRCEELYLNIKC